MTKQNLHGRKPSDYVFTIDPDGNKVIYDLWKYDSLEDAFDPKTICYRYATIEELPELVRECEEMGCFDEDS